MICAVVPLAPFHATMVPVIESKMKREAPSTPPPGGGIWKSLVELPTAPVGRPPGMLIVCGLALRTTGAPPTSPFTSCVVLVPLLAIQKGLVPLNVIPQQFTSNGSRTGASPGISEINVVSRYADPGGIGGTAGVDLVSSWACAGLTERCGNSIAPNNPVITKANKMWRGLMTRAFISILPIRLGSMSDSWSAAKEPLPQQ